MNLVLLDYVFLLGYLMLILAVGIRFSKSNRSTDTYFFADRKVPGWLLGLSLVGTSISSITFLAYPADAFKTDWLRYLPNLALPIAIILAATIFLPYFRRQNAQTAYQVLEPRFGASIRLYASVAFIITQWLRVSMILYLLSLLVEYLLSVPPIFAIFISGLVVGSYTYIGGIQAVIWTDALQTLMLIFGGIICWVFIWQAMPNGFNQIIEIAQTADKFGFTGGLENTGQNPWRFSLSEKTALMMLFVGLSAWLTEYSANQNTVQRYIAARSETQGRVGLGVYLVSSLPIWAFYMFLGTSIYAFFHVFPSTQSQAILNGQASAEYILPYFISYFLPQGVAGLLIAAALAAAMSSLDSSLNAISTVGIYDIYKRFTSRERDDQHYLKVAHFITGCSTLIMMLGATAFYAVQEVTLQHAATLLTALLGSGILGVFILAIFTQRNFRTRHLWFGLCATWCFTGWGILTDHNLLPAILNLPIDLYYVGIVGNLIFLAVVLLLSRQKKNAHQPDNPDNHDTPTQGPHRNRTSEVNLNIDDTPQPIKRSFHRDTV